MEEIEDHKIFKFEGIFFILKPTSHLLCTESEEQEGWEEATQGDTAG